MRDVSTKVVLDQLTYLRHRGLPDGGLRDTFSRLVELTETSRGAAYVSWDEFAPFVGAFAAFLRDHDGGSDGYMRFTLASQGTWLGAITRLIALVADARGVYRLMAGFVGRKRFHGARASVIDLPDGRLEMSVSLAERCAPCPAFFHFHGSGMEHLTTVLGMPRAVVEMTGDGARQATYRITLPPRRPFLARLVALLPGERASLRRAYERLLTSETELAHARNDLERRVEERTRELLAAKDAAETASRAKSAFLANLSHELRTPLVAILGFSTLLHDERDPQVLVNGLSAIDRNGQHLMRLIDDLLDLARVESGQLAIERVPIDPTDELNHVIAALRPKASQKGVDLRLQIDASVPAKIVSDALRLRQVLFNIIGNAVKFTPRGSVEVEASTEVQNGHTILVVRITDTGEGVLPEAARAIFDPFVQGDGSLSRRYEGAGLGLPIAREVARKLGGDVVLLKSTPGRGSVFVVSIAVGQDVSGV